MKKALLIPIKEPLRAKMRLANLLTLAERQQLVWAMFEDVCRAVAAAQTADQVFVVSSFQKAIDYARSFGWQVLTEAAQESESASVDWASQVLGERGFDAVCRLPADLPLVQGADLDALLEIEIPAPGALLVPSFEGTGTNAILRTPPCLFPSRFGPNSLALHKQEALGAGAACLVVENPRIALDIDEPQDVKRFLESATGTTTFCLLEEMKIRERLLQLAKR
jgi:2-phospho-L-lactate guanylyltransferase